MTLTVEELIGTISCEASYALRYRNGEDTDRLRQALINIHALASKVDDQLKERGEGE
jgi:hypothetical protein